MSDSNITKKALAQALKGLMAEQPFSKISVGDICEECGMSRKSFYYHFKDKYDLVNWVFYTEFIEAMSVSDYQNGWALFAAVCSYFYHERGFYRSALLIEGQNSFPDYFREVMTPLLEYLFQELYTVEQDARFFFDFLIDAFLSAIARWLIDERGVSDEEFLHRMHTVLVSLAKATLKDLDNEQ